MSVTFNTLVVLAQLYSGIPAPTDGPSYEALNRLEILFLEKKEIEQRVCGGIGNCDGNNIAAYLLGSTRIVATDTCINFEENVYCQGVLIHEMVHFLQYLNGKYRSFQKGPFDETVLCAQYIENEAQAYKAQRKFLIDNNANVDWTIDDALKKYSCVIPNEN